MFRVNIFSGALCLDVEGFSLPGPLPVTFQHSYTSETLFDGRLGPGWTYPFHIYLRRQRGEWALLVDGEERFRWGPAPAPTADGDEVPFHVRRLGSAGWAVTSKAEGLTYQFTGDGDGQPVAAILDRFDNRLSFENDQLGRPASLTDSLGRRLEFRYEGALLREVVLARHAGRVIGHRLLECQYGGRGHLVASTDARGGKHRYAYDGRFLIEYTNSLGGTYCATYESSGRCLRYWEKQGRRSRTLRYDLRNHCTQVLDSLGYVTLYRFTEGGALLERVNALGGVTRSVLDDRDQLITTQGPTGQLSSIQYTRDDGKVCTTFANGATTAAEVNGRGELLSVVDACGHEWSYEYDKQGTPSAILTPCGHRWRLEHDSHGELVRVTDPDGRAETYTRSEDGLEEVTKADGAPELVLKLDSLGRPVSYFSPVNQSELRILREGPREKLIFPDGSAEELEFDATGRLVRFRDEAGNVWRYTYDPYGRCLSRTDPLGYALRYEYDEDGRPLALINENGDRFENTYNPLGWVVRQVGFDGRSRSFEYDDAGCLIGRTDGNGQRLAIEPDALGQPQVRHYPGGVRVESLFDPLGRPVVAGDPQVPVERAFDPDGRLVREAAGDFETEFEYGWRPFPVRVRCAGRTVDYTYDHRGRLGSVTEADQFRADFSYQEAGGGETVRFHTGLRVERVYNASNQLARQTVTSPRGQTLLSTRFRYDPTGRLQERARDGGSTLTFSHNKRGELTEVKRDGDRVAWYEYDGAGNRVLANGSGSRTGRGNRLLSSAQGEYRYDGEGRPTTRGGPGASVEFAYDVLGRLSEVRREGALPASFRYDARFRRVQKTSEAGTQRTWWVGDAVFQEERPDGSLVGYVLHPIEQLPLAFHSGGEWYFIIADHHGEPTDLIRASDSQVVWSSEPWGFEAPVLLDPEGLGFPLRSPGQYKDPETGLVYHRARYYDPREGRFLHPDPIDIYGGWNVYRFCENQPLLFIDPLGLTSTCGMSAYECQQLYDAIDRQTAELEKRWDEMANPAEILPWSGAPPVGQVYRNTSLRRASGQIIKRGTVSKGSVESHIREYDSVQSGGGAAEGGLHRRLQRYHAGNCMRWHRGDTAKDKRITEAGQWATKRPELPTYPPPPPNIAAML
jgi:RHS repeat-associated protein